VFPDCCFHSQLLLNRARLQHDSPDVPDVGIDEAVPFFGVPVRHRPGDTSGMARLAGLPAGTPGLRCLSSPQGAVAEGEEARCRRREQGRSGNRWYQTASTDRREEPETENSEQRDEASSQDYQHAPGAFVAVPVEVQGDFSSGQDGEKQARPHQGGVLAAVKSLGGEIAGQAV
jgi:hypothetical protein